MKGNNNFIYVGILCLSISFISCLTMQRRHNPYDDIIYLSEATKKDRNREILQVIIDTIDVVKLKSLKKVTIYEYTRRYSKISLYDVIEMLSQLDSVNQIVIRGEDSIPSNISKLKKLRGLAIVNANFEKVPECLGELRDLQFLQIGYSDRYFIEKRISQLPNSLSQLKELRTFKLFYTGVKSLPTGICDLQNLYLEVKRSKIDSIPNCICNIGGLRGIKEDLIIKLPCADKFRYKEVEAIPMPEPRSEPVSKRKYYVRTFFIEIWSKIYTWWVFNIG